ncbi:DMT family transporter [Rhizobium sp. G21]|uniref:DMT family transporter n=1 Tax=Rhizobium sp. G21 TaxID=2758439 RepID=UPI001600FD00|nr:DMT family transporter [Rhizobium sp. G21]MBB1248854.1 DMT family transporter [Rhizobium sp. G21]
MNKSVLSGVALTVFAYFLFSLQDASVKFLAVGLPIAQILFVRSVVILALCLAVGGKNLPVAMARSPVLVPMLSRNVLLLLAWLTFYTASRDLGLAQLTTIYYASPVIVTLLAAPMLKEYVPPLRWLAVAVGFCGVLFASDPFADGLGLSRPVALALSAAVFWALSAILLRKTAMAERTLVQMAISSGFFILMTGAACIFLWTPVSLGLLALLAGVGIFAGVAQFAYFESIRRAPVSLLAPFEYTSLVWAFILGYAIWGDQPQWHVFGGAALIAVAGALALLSERKKGAAATSQA